MDRSAITSALKIAKGIVTSHGISTYLTQHMRNVAARPVEPTDTGFRLDYCLDPERSPWQDNPGCSIHVSYIPSPKGSVVREGGDLVHDYNLSITVRAGSDDMTISRLRVREVLVSNLSMLCDMLEASLPPVATVIVMTAEQHKAKTELAAEQIVGWNIHDRLGHDSLKGLRKGGRSKLFHNNGIAPDGTYRYTHVRRKNSRGVVTDQAKYVMRVNGGTLMIKRIE
jgi:hypothetical protein